MTDLTLIRSHAAAIVAEIDGATPAPTPDPIPVPDPGPAPTPPPSPIPVPPTPPIVGGNAVSGLQELMDKVRDMTGGGTIEVRPGVGSYGAVTLTAKPAAGLKILGAGGHFESIRVVGGRNLTLEALDVWPLRDVVYSGKGAHPYLVDVDQASDQIAVIGCDLRSTRDAAGFIDWAVTEWKRHQVSGVFMKGTRGTVRGCSATGVYFGFNMMGAQGALEDSRVWGFMADAMRALGDGVAVRRNWATDAFNMNGNHPDGLQAFQNGDTLDGLAIEDNLIIEWTDMGRADHPSRARLQQIGAHNGPYSTVKCTGNVTAGSSANALHFNRTTGLDLRGNTVFTQPGPLNYRGRIRLVGCPGAQAADNQADVFVGTPAGAKPDPAKLAAFLVPARRGAARPDLTLAR